MGRSPCCEKIGLNRGKWSAEEDDKLVKYIKANGEGSWRSLPKNAGLLRCGKSCRLRWINYLRADVKRGNFTQHEEETIVKLHKTLGNKWSLIARHLPGRTDNEIKNYWNSHLSRTIYRYRFIGEAPADMIETTTKKKLGPTSGKKNAAEAVLVGVGLEPSGRNDEGKLSDTSSPKDAFMLSPDDAQGMEMDDDILMHLNYFLQDGPTDQSHNGLMEMDSGGGSSSDLDLYACVSPVVSYFTDDMLQCLSPVVSYFTDDVLQWDHNGAGGELDLWTEGDDILIWS